MSTAVQPRTRLSGSARRRAKAIARRENVQRLIERIEDREFFENGTIPASATRVSICSCGARTFSRIGNEDWESEEGWDAAHAFCGDEVSA